LPRKGGWQHTSITQEAAEMGKRPIMSKFSELKKKWNDVSNKNKNVLNISMKK
jgi:hypothetical protein